MSSDALFSRRGLATYRQWMGISDTTREDLQRRYPSHENAIEAMEYGNFVARREAIRVLGALGDFDAVLRYGLAERESGWIPKLASLLLVSPPMELLVCWTSKLKPTGDGSHIDDFIAFDLPWIHYGYIAEELVAYLSKAKRRLAKLKSGHFEALGLSALAPACKLLTPQVGIDTLRSFQQALDAGEPRKDCRPSHSDLQGYEDRQLDRNSSSAIAAVCALRRLGHPVDAARVIAWIEQLDHLFGKYEQHFEHWNSTAALRWVLFDLGDDSQLEKFLDPIPNEWAYDVAMTLMRRGEVARLATWLGAIEERAAIRQRSVFPPASVHFWPMIDYLQSCGHVLEPIADSGYLMARATGVAAPHGWSWKCAPADD
jgi:hypothetical protein